MKNTHTRETDLKLLHEIREILTDTTEHVKRFIEEKSVWQVCANIHNAFANKWTGHYERLTSSTVCVN